MRRDSPINVWLRPSAALEDDCHHRAGPDELFDLICIKLLGQGKAGCP